MTDIKVVIGANFGDEGKGLATDFFTAQYTKQNKKCLNVLSNGGPQRGHTVDTVNGEHHIFKHFGSGTFAGADTYLPDCFLINPMEFHREYEELKNIIHFMPKVYYNPLCKFTTPWDMIVNQIVEESRGDKKHGSCGMGIWETVVRASVIENRLTTIATFNSMTKERQAEKLKELRDGYFVNRLKEYGIPEVPKEWKDIFFSETLINNYIFDIRFFIRNATATTDTIMQLYPALVFENGQGLLLDQHLTFYENNTTPSNTGGDNALGLIDLALKQPCNIELCYVTRTYMTRHGVGRFETECNRTLLGNVNADVNNVTNEFQGNLRYGELIIDNLTHRVTNDAAKFKRFSNVKTSVMVTHMNEAKIDTEKLKSAYGINKVYTSDTKYRESVKECQ